jgi:hypothetical protein
MTAGDAGGDRPALSPPTLGSFGQGGSGAQYGQSLNFEW